MKKRPMLIKTLIIISVCIITLSCVTLGLYSFGYIGFEDGKIQFNFNSEGDDPNNGDDPVTPTTTYTIHLAFPDNTVVDYQYDTINGVFAPTAQNDWIDDQTTMYRFDNWYINEGRTEAYSKILLRDGMTLYAKMIEQVNIKLYVPTPTSLLTDYDSYTIDKNTIFYVDTKLTFSTSALFGVYSNSSFTTPALSTFLANASKNLYIRWSSPQSDFAWDTSLINDPDDGNAHISDYAGTDETVYVPSEYVDPVTGHYYDVIIDDIDNDTVVTINISADGELADDATITGDSLTAINVDSNNNDYSSADGVLFDKDKTDLMIFPSGRTGEYEIPSTVTTIEEDAFLDSSITGVTISDNVTTIGENAFEGSDSLTTVNLEPDEPPTVSDNSFPTSGVSFNVDLDYIDAYRDSTYWSSYYSNIKVMSTDQLAFEWAIHTINGVDEAWVETFTTYGSGLSEVHIPDTYIYFNSITQEYESYPVRCINVGAFADYNLSMHGLTSISMTTLYVPGSIKEIGSNAFVGCDTLTTVYIDEGVQKIGGLAFSECSSLENIHLPNSLRYLGGTDALGGYVFQACTSLRTIEIPDGVLTIGDSAFVGCTALIGISIPSSVTTIGYRAFNSCNALTGVQFDASVTTINDYMFEYCSSLSSFSISSTVTSIGEFAFRGCSSLHSINLSSSSITTIGRWAFNQCVMLTNLEIPSTVVSIGEYAFGDCIGLSSLTIPTNTNLISIGAFAFSGCSSLEVVTVDTTNLTSLGNGVFSDCIALMSVTLPSNITDLGDYAFSNCSALTIISWPSSLVRIGQSAFARCSVLENFTIPASVTSIGERAFEDCSTLTTILISSNVTSIGTRAFEDCSSLISIRFEATTPPILGSSPFVSLTEYPIYVPAASLSAYQTATSWSSYYDRLQSY